MTLSKIQMTAATMLVAIASSANAQSHVSVYGAIDTAIGREYSDVANVGMLTNYLGTTHIGFQGSEDLGNGLKLNFQLEAGGMSSDTGAWTDGFSRESWLGVSGGFGSFMMGRTTTPQDRLMGQFDLNGTSTGASMKVLDIAANNSLLGSRQSNQLQYATPNLHGFEARIAYAFSETASGPHKKNDFLQVAAAYKIDGLSVGAAFQPKRFTGELKTNTSYRNGYSLGAKYDFGVAQASVVYTRNEKVTEGDGWGIGVAAPIGAWHVGAQFARLTNVKHANGTKSDKQGSHAYELFANYKMSKRTALYAIYGSVNSQAQQAFKLENDNTFAVGVTHKF